MKKISLLQYVSCFEWESDKVFNIAVSTNADELEKVKDSIKREREHFIVDLKKEKEKIFKKHNYKYGDMTECMLTELKEIETLTYVKYKALNDYLRDVVPIYLVVNEEQDFEFEIDEVNLI